MPSDTTARMAVITGTRHRVFFVISIKAISVFSFEAAAIHSGTHARSSRFLCAIVMILINVTTANVARCRFRAIGRNRRAAELSDQRGSAAEAQIVALHLVIMHDRAQDAVE